jgi:signal transduction histidine kinase
LQASVLMNALLGGALVAVVTLAFAVNAARRAASRFRQRVQAVQSAADAELGRLSHALHDDVGQTLIALKVQLQLSRLPGVTGVATHEACVALLDTAIADVRSLSHALRPAPFDEGQLVPALTALAKTEGGRAGLCVLVDTPEHDLTLPREIELTCYRVVREAFANIVKHARAQNVAVSVQHEPDALAVIVADDGRGFDIGPVARRAVVAGRLGLVGMQERTEHVGGTLTIRSQRGAGTTIVCRVPLKAAAA